jgi:hypothetical protein
VILGWAATAQAEDPVLTFLSLLNAVGLASAYVLCVPAARDLAAVRLDARARDTRQDAGTDVGIEVSRPPLIGFAASRKESAIARRTFNWIDGLALACPLLSELATRHEMTYITHRRPDAEQLTWI